MFVKYMFNRHIVQECDPVVYAQVSVFLIQLHQSCVVLLPGDVQNTRQCAICHAC